MMRVEKKSMPARPAIRCNDNLIELKKLPGKSIDLVYIDPPYKTNKHQGDYDDRWDGDTGYIDFMRPRLQELHRVIKDTGNLYIHVDHNADIQVRTLANEIFGKENVKPPIAFVKPNSAKNVTRGWGSQMDTIIHAVKSPAFTFNDQYRDFSPATIKRYNSEDGKGRFYWKPVNAHGMAKYAGRKKFAYHGCTKDWMFSPETMDTLLAKGELKITDDCNIYYKFRQNPRGTKVRNVWNDIKYASKKRYSTEKPEKLLDRVILSSSNPGDTILDAFAGSGTTCAVAQKLGRKSICIDQNQKACKIMEGRFR
jgi:adenine-specific DNA-methyltransferase